MAAWFGRIAKRSLLPSGRSRSGPMDEAKPDRRRLPSAALAWGDFDGQPLPVPQQFDPTGHFDPIG